MKKASEVRFTIRISQKDNFLLEEAIADRKVPISKQRFILEALHEKIDASKTNRVRWVTLDDKWVGVNLARAPEEG